MPSPPKARRRRYPKNVRLSKYGEIRVMTRLLAELSNQPEASRLWHEIGRSFTMAETAEIEIIEANVQIESTVTIGLDESTSRAVYALCWDRFEEALVNLNKLYNTTPDEGQKYAFNRVKRLLWAARDVEKYADALFSMTALPEDIDADEQYDDPED